MNDMKVKIERHHEILPPIKRVIQFIVLILTMSSYQHSVVGQRPNVILVDDYHHDWMHHMGKSYMHTPYLDQLAKEGWSFLWTMTQ